MYILTVHVDQMINSVIAVSIGRLISLVKAGPMLEADITCKSTLAQWSRLLDSQIEEDIKHSKLR